MSIRWDKVLSQMSVLTIYWFKSDVTVPNRCTCFSQWNQVKSWRELFSSKKLPLGSHVIGYKIWRSKAHDHYHGQQSRFKSLLPARVFVWNQIHSYDVGTYHLYRIITTCYGAFHGIGIGSITKLGQKEPRPIQTFTVRAALTRSIKTKIGLGQRKMLKFSLKNQ